VGDINFKVDFCHKKFKKSGFEGFNPQILREEWI
jgi:hypothetical protein